MKPIDDKKYKVTIRTVTHDEEGRKRVEKMELPTHNIDSIVRREEAHRQRRAATRTPPVRRDWDREAAA
ncbi:hypothetical protein ACFX2I_013693 [Malus domestica]